MTAIGYVPGATVRRTAAVPAIDSGGISVLAAQPGLLGTLGGSVARGHVPRTRPRPGTRRWSSARSPRRPSASTRCAPATQVYLGGRYFTVIGILRPVPLAPEIDEAALVGFPVGRRAARAGRPRRPRSTCARLPDQVQAVASVLPFTANPAQPEAVQVSLPSSILAARAAARTAFTGLFLGLGAVAVLVGGVGIANIMVISVLERRAEIGLRRALGATRWQVGAAVPDRVAAAVRRWAGWPGIAARGGGHRRVTRAGARPARRGPAAASRPASASPLGTGALAGAYPAARAARLAPAEALRGP